MPDGFMPPLEYPRGMVFGKPNCGVVACAVVAGVPYVKAEHWFFLHGSDHGKPFRSSWKGYTWHKNYSRFLNEQNVAHVYVEYPKPIVLAKWVEHAKPNVTYLVRVRGHVMVYRSGWLLDQHQIAQLGKHRASKTRVQQTWEIL